MCAVAGLVASGVIIFGGNNTSAIAENVVGSEQIVKDNPELILLETPKLKTKNTETKIATLYPDGSSDLNYDIEKNSAGELVPIVPAENDAEYIVNNASDKEMDKLLTYFSNSTPEEFVSEVYGLRESDETTNNILNAQKKENFENAFGEDINVQQVDPSSKASVDLLNLAYKKNTKKKQSTRIKNIENYPQAPVIITNIENKAQPVNSNVDQTNLNYEDGFINSAIVSKISDKQTELVPIDDKHSGLFNETTVQGVSIRPSETVNTKSFTQNTQTQFLNMQAQAVINGKLFFRPNPPMVVPNSNGSFNLNPELKFKDGMPQGVKFTAGLNAPAPDGFAQNITTGTRLSRFKAASEASLNIGGIVGSQTVGKKYGYGNNTEVNQYGVIAGSNTQRTFSAFNSKNNNFTTKISSRAVYANTYNPEANIANLAGLIPLTLEDEKKQAENARIKREQNPNLAIPPFEASNPSNKFDSRSVKILTERNKQAVFRTIPPVANAVESTITTHPNTGNSFGYQYSAGSTPVQTRDFSVTNTEQVSPNNLKLQKLMDMTTGNQNTKTKINGQNVTGLDVAAISGVAVFEGTGKP